MQHGAMRRLGGLLKLSLVFLLFHVMACQSSKKSSDAVPQDPLVNACSMDGHGTWSNNSCLCASGWSIDTTTGRCTISTATRSPQDGCQSTSGVWNGSSCTCPNATYWDVTNNICSSGSNTSMTQVTQAQCQATSNTGAYWNGSACLCQNVSYPYWNPSLNQCSSTSQSTTSVVGTISQTQCTSASATGAYWNGQACQCTSASYPYWNTSLLQCGSSLTGTTSNTTTIPGQGTCSLGQLSLSGQCVSIVSLAPKSGCQATGGSWGLITKCSCPTGLNWYPPLKTCQNPQTLTGVGPSLCAATGGQSISTTQCTCPSSTTLYRDGLTGNLFCG